MVFATLFVAYRSSPFICQRGDAGSIDLQHSRIFIPRSPVLCRDQENFEPVIKGDAGFINLEHSNVSVASPLVLHCDQESFEHVVRRAAPRPVYPEHSNVSLPPTPVFHRDQEYLESRRIAPIPVNVECSNVSTVKSPALYRDQENFEHVARRSNPILIDSETTGNVPMDEDALASSSTLFSEIPGSSEPADVDAHASLPALFNGVSLPILNPALQDFPAPFPLTFNRLLSPSRLATNSLALNLIRFLALDLLSSSSLVHRTLDMTPDNPASWTLLGVRQSLEGALGGNAVSDGGLNINPEVPALTHIRTMPNSIVDFVHHVDRDYDSSATSSEAEYDVASAALDSFDFLDRVDQGGFSRRPTVFTGPIASGDPTGDFGLRPLPRLTGYFGRDPDEDNTAERLSRESRRNRPIYGPGFLEAHPEPQEPDHAFDPTSPARWNPAFSPIRDFAIRSLDAPFDSGHGDPETADYWPRRRYVGDTRNVGPAPNRLQVPWAITRTESNFPGCNSGMARGSSARPRGGAPVLRLNPRPESQIVYEPPLPGSESRTTRGLPTRQRDGAPVPGGPPPYQSHPSDSQIVNRAIATEGPGTAPTPYLPPYRAETVPPPPYSPEILPPPYPDNAPPSRLADVIDTLNAALRYGAGITQIRPDLSSRLASLAIARLTLPVWQFRFLREAVCSAPRWLHAEAPTVPWPIRRLSVRADVLGDDYVLRLESILESNDGHRVTAPDDEVLMDSLSSSRDETIPYCEDSVDVARALSSDDGPPARLVDAVATLNVALRHSAGIAQTHISWTSRRRGLEIVMSSLSGPHFRLLREAVFAVPPQFGASGASSLLGPTRRLLVSTTVLDGGGYGARLARVLDHHDGRWDEVYDTDIQLDADRPSD